MEMLTEQPAGQMEGTMDGGSQATINRSSVDDRRDPTRGRRLSDALISLCVVADIGFQRSGRALTEMTNTQTETKAAQVRQLAVTAIPDLVGGPGVVVVGTYLRITGDVQGHMVLMLPLGDAQRLADMILGESPEAPEELSDMARSALAEVGNITGSFFLAALADATTLQLSPSPPSVVVDMSGALLDTVLADLGQESDEVFVIDTVFVQNQRHVNAVFLVLPPRRYFDLMIDKLPR